MTPATKSFLLGTASVVLGFVIAINAQKLVDKYVWKA